MVLAVHSFLTSVMIIPLVRPIALRPFAGLLIVVSLLLGRSATAQCGFSISLPDTIKFSADAGRTVVQRVLISSSSSNGFGVDIGGNPLFTLGEIPCIPKDTLTVFLSFSPKDYFPGATTTTLEIRDGMAHCSQFYTLVGTVNKPTDADVINPGAVPASFLLSPNPATHYVEATLSGLRSATITVFDMLGRTMATATANSSWRWDASSTAPGSYIIRVEGEASDGRAFVSSRKVVIDR
jgi:hypothetical protein